MPMISSEIIGMVEMADRFDLERANDGDSSYVLQALREATEDNLSKIVPLIPKDMLSWLAYSIIANRPNTKTDQVTILEHLLAAGLDINNDDAEELDDLSDSMPMTLLGRAIAHGRDDIMQWLLQHGADPMLNRAEALSLALMKARLALDIRGRGRALLVPLLNASLAPVLLRRGLAQYYFGDGWSLFRIRPRVRSRLRGLDLADIDRTERVLRAALGPNLTGYVLRAL